MDIDWITIIFTALPSSFLGLLLAHYFIIFRDRDKKRKDLKNKKELIIKDLVRIKSLLDQMNKDLSQLQLIFNKKYLGKFNSSALEDLHTEIYDSVTNPELYLIFKTDIFDIVAIYSAIRFLKETSATIIYSNYINTVIKYAQNHPDEKDIDPFESRFLELPQQQIINNKNSIKKVYEVIIKVAKKYENKTMRL